MWVSRLLWHLCSGISGGTATILSSPEMLLLKIAVATPTCLVGDFWHNTGNQMG